MTIILTALFALFSNVIDASQQARGKMKRDQVGRAILNIIEEDLRYAIPDTKTDGLKFVANNSSSIFEEQELLSFATTTSLRFQEHEGDITFQYVTYLLREQDNGYTLIRKERPYPTVVGDFATLSYELAENVVDCTFEYYNDEYNEFQAEWNIEKSSPPSAIRVTLALGTAESPYNYVLTIPLLSKKSNKDDG